METSEKGWPALRSEYACRRSGKAGPPVGRPEEPSRMAASRSGFSLELTSPCSMMAARLVQNGPRNRLRSSARRCWCGAAGGAAGGTGGVDASVDWWLRVRRAIA